MENHDIIKSAQNGDRVAITKLLLENRPIFISVTSRLISSVESRKDVIQNIFLKVIKGIGTFQNKCRFTTWLYRLAVNECMDFNRRQNPINLENSFHSERDFSLVDPNAPDGLTTLTRLELRIEINAALSRLTRDQKTAFILFYSGGYSGKEASEVMKISEPNFFMKLKAARDTVRKHLSEKGLL